jgi:hypothetical protein
MPINLLGIEDTRRDTLDISVVIPAYGEEAR